MTSKGSLNKVILIGNLVYEPELKEISPNVFRCRMVVATNRKWKTESGEVKEEAEYHRIVAWQKLAELCGQILEKGKKVYVEGRLATREWDGADGLRKKETEIVLEEVIALEAAKAETAEVTDPSVPF